MDKGDGAQRSVMEHVLWCRDKRDALAEELGQCKAGTLTIGKTMVGQAYTQGSLTHIAYLQRTIEQLGRVIAAYSPPNDQ